MGASYKKRLLYFGGTLSLCYGFEAPKGRLKKTSRTNFAFWPKLGGGPTCYVVYSPSLECAKKHSQPI